MKENTGKHWLVLALLCGLAGGSIGICSNTVGVFYTPVSEDLGVLRGTFALHSTLSLVATGLTALVIPTSMKRYPYKRILFTGVSLAVLSTIAMSLSRNVMLFYILGILRGIGAGAFAAVPITMTINNWFEKKHGLATSIALSFSGVAGAVCTPLLTACIEKYGWETGYLFQAGLILLLTTPAIIYPYTLKPEGMQLLPYGYEGKKNRSQETGGMKPKKFNCFTVSFLCFCIFSLLHTSISGIGQHMTGFAQSIGYPAGIGAAMVSCAMAGNIGSKLLIGLLSDALGPLKASIIMILANAASLLVMFVGGIAGQQSLLLIGAVIYGTVYSVGAVGTALMTKYFFGEENYSAAFSIIGLLTNIGASSSLTLIGYIYDFTGSYNYALLGSVGIHILNLTLLTIIVLTKQGRNNL